MRERNIGLMAGDDAGPISRSRLWIAIAVVGILAALVYANSLANGFAYDDVFVIRDNTRVHDLGDMEAVWAAPYWPHSGREYGLYRPLTTFVFAAQWAVFDGSPLGFHAVNIALHCVVSILTLLLLTRLVPIGPALAGATVFAVHPVHTEVVANVVGQAELIAAAAVLAACWIYAGTDREAEIRPARMALIAGLYAIGLFAKESAVVLPALLLAIDAARQRIGRGVRAIFSYGRETFGLWGTLCAVLAANFAVRVAVLGAIRGADPGPWYPFLHDSASRILTAFRFWPEYARLLFFPADLSADYSPAVILPVETVTPLVALGAALMLGIVALAIATPRRPGLGLGAVWFLVAILPASNLLFPTGVMVAERTLYLPSFAVAIAVAWGGASLATATPRRRLAFAAVLVVAIVAGGFRTATRNPDWKDTDAVMDALLRDHPESYRAQWSAGSRALEAGDTALALEHLEFARRLWAGDAQLLTDYGALQLARRRYAHAIDLLEAAVRAYDGLPRAHEFLAAAYIDTGRYDDALAAIDRAISITGPTAGAFDLRGRALLGLGRGEEAAAAFTTSIRQPAGDRWDRWGLLARALVAYGRLEEARRALDSARIRTGGDSTALRALREAEAEMFPGPGPRSGVNAAGPSVTDSANALQDARSRRPATPGVSSSRGAQVMLH